jgi:hypothetical protein
VGDEERVEREGLSDFVKEETFMLEKGRAR